MNADITPDLVKDIIQSVQKARKSLKIYAKNNPVYAKTLKDIHGKFQEYFKMNDSLKLGFRQYEIFYGQEQVYHNSRKNDNLALLFSKDGFQEIKFEKNLSQGELEDFLLIISKDYEQDSCDSDMATLFWEKDFQDISFKIEDPLLGESDNFEAKAMKELGEDASSFDKLQSVYNNSPLERESVTDVQAVSLTGSDFELLIKEIEKVPEDKLGKLIGILFELLYDSEKTEEYSDIVNYFMKCIEYSITQENISLVTEIQETLKTIIDDKNTSKEIRRVAQTVMASIGSNRIVGLIGDLLDSGRMIDKSIFLKYMKSLDSRAILPAMNVLGNLQSIHARKYFIDGLAYLGKKDLSVLYKGLKDSRWYVVRNIVYILRLIGDSAAVESLLPIAEHNDIRVKKEVIKSLGALGGTKGMSALRLCLEDNDKAVRIVALHALVDTGSEAAKRIIMEYISTKDFLNKTFNEKKEFFSVLARWKDREVYDFLVHNIEKNSLWKKSKNFENRACAAYSLGLLGNKDAIQILDKYKTVGNKILRELSSEAIKNIGHVG